MLRRPTIIVWTISLFISGCTPALSNQNPIDDCEGCDLRTDLEESIQAAFATFAEVRGAADDLRTDDYGRAAIAYSAIAARRPAADAIEIAGTILDEKIDGVHPDYLRELARFALTPHGHTGCYSGPVYRGALVAGTDPGTAAAMQSRLSQAFLSSEIATGALIASVSPDNAITMAEELTLLMEEVEGTDYVSLADDQIDRLLETALIKGHSLEYVHRQWADAWLRFSELTADHGVYNNSDAANRAMAALKIALWTGVDVIEIDEWYSSFKSAEGLRQAFDEDWMAAKLARAAMFSGLHYNEALALASTIIDAPDEVPELYDRVAVAIAVLASSSEHPAIARFDFHRLD